MCGIDRLTKKRLLFLLCSPGFLFYLSFPLFAEYPEIRSLSTRDVLFSQLQNEITVYYKAASRGKTEAIAGLKFFTVMPTEYESIFSLAARVNIPYETIATLNRLPTSADYSTAQHLLIPNCPGLFIPKIPENDLETIMQAWRLKEDKTPIPVIILQNNKPYEFLFFPGERFHPIERAFFLKLLFRFPLAKGVKTSSYGYRKDPFTGHSSFHGGIDLAAPVGSAVYSARDGKVKFCGYSDVLGNYVIVTHSSGYETWYGHLQKIAVSVGMDVDTGTILGTVGLTGKTTGAHLHFEIRKQGKRENPESLLRN
ncbi:MAG: M23 family metallopeptidase [Spirochaetales bacterium]|nr:M23 family metallopeptidase [Spirochaetales bacterium]